MTVVFSESTWRSIKELAQLQGLEIPAAISRAVALALSAEKAKKRS